VSTVFWLIILYMTRTVQLPPTTANDCFIFWISYTGLMRPKIKFKSTAFTVCSQCQISSTSVKRFRRWSIMISALWVHFMYFVNDAYRGIFLISSSVPATTTYNTLTSVESYLLAAALGICMYSSHALEQIYCSPGGKINGMPCW
jgi:hypothetical protein